MRVLFLFTITFKVYPYSSNISNPYSIPSCKDFTSFFNEGTNVLTINWSSSESVLVRGNAMNLTSVFSGILQVELTILEYPYNI